MKQNAAPSDSSVHDGGIDLPHAGDDVGDVRIGIFRVYGNPDEGVAVVERARGHAGPSIAACASRRSPRSRKHAVRSKMAGALVTTAPPSPAAMVLHSWKM